MITINLLPDRYRRDERTSPRLLAATLLSVICVSGSLGWLGLTWFGDLAAAEAQLGELKDQMSQLKPSVDRHAALTAEQADFQQREKTIQQISDERMVWTPIIDEIIDVASGSDPSMHTVWFDDLTITPPARKKGGPKLKLPSRAQGGDVRKVVNFREDIESRDFFQFVAEESQLEGKTDNDADRQPSAFTKFTYELTFEAAKKRKEIRKQLEAAQAALEKKEKQAGRPRAGAAANNPGNQRGK